MNVFRIYREVKSGDLEDYYIAKVPRNRQVMA